MGSDQSNLVSLVPSAPSSSEVAGEEETITLNGVVFARLSSILKDFFPSQNLTNCVSFGFTEARPTRALTEYSFVLRPTVSRQKSSKETKSTTRSMCQAEQRSFTKGLPVDLLKSFVFVI